MSGKKTLINKFDEQTLVNNEREIPKALKFEEAVLGAILLEGNIADAVMNQISEDLFYDSRHKVICNVVVSLYKSNKPIDVLTVIQEVKARKLFSEIGADETYVLSLANSVVSSANVEYHLRILQQEALRRKLILNCTKGVTYGYDTGVDIFDSYNKIINDLDLSVKELMKYEVLSVGEIHNLVIQESINVLNSGGVSGVKSGLRMVDKLTNGWQKSDLIILAGRPGMGKTAAAVSMCLFPSLYQREAVAIFSLEMSKEQLTSRIQANVSKSINVSEIVKKQLNLQQIELLKKECEPLLTTPLYIDDTPNISLLELKGKARKLVRENGVKMIVIDYLQLMRSGSNIGNREQEIAEISRGLKGLAKELNIPIIALSQLSRVVESRSDKKPILSDLRESGQIEQDADMVIFCYRPEYYNITNYEVGDEQFNTEGLFMFIVAKHRNGEVGEIPLSFIHSQTKVQDHHYDQSNFLPPVSKHTINNDFDNEDNIF